ncbi:NF038120 family PEP-CTERM protein [Duganella hordei]|uniref:NF038120 family PEP-CTERM protein n=1 Tax=Duganella hordei TaxID=2865934 RepID=UPI0030E81FAF
MNHFTQLKTIGAATFGALALMGAAPAMADTINFETIGSAIYNGTETFSEAGYNMTVIDTPASETGTGFAGGVGNGSDPYLCEIAACPTGNGSYFYMGLNDGTLKVSRADNQAFRLYSVDYAFLPPVGGLAGYSYGQMTVVGQKVGGGTVSFNYDFPALIGGQSPFLGAALSHDFGSTAFSSVTIGACLFDGASCVHPAGNQAQFSIDNLNLAAVPEPETYAMMGLGLAVISLLSRRRAKKAASINA